MTFNTRNPIGSTDARDRSDNSEFLDEVVNSLDLTKVDRLGVTRDTLEGIYQKSAYYRAGTFDAGYTLTNNRQTLAYGNIEYSWSGSFPKVVAAGSTPGTTGGIGAGAWVDRTDLTLRNELSLSGGAAMVGTPAGDLYDYFPAKVDTFPIKNIYPEMSISDINALLATKGSFYFNDGTYLVPSSVLPSENSKIIFSPESILKPTIDGIDVINMTSVTPASSYLRNCVIHGPRIDLTGRNNCKGIRAYRTRNNSSIFKPWVDMGLGSNNIGVLVEHLCYGLELENPEVINGGVGSTRILIRNGSNAIALLHPKLYSRDPSGIKPDYGIVIFNSINGDYVVDNITTFATASVNVIGGFSQDTTLYGLLDQSVSANIQGTYFERNASSDVSLGAGSYYFNANNTHHSGSVGNSCYKGRGAHYARIGNFNPVARSIGTFDFTEGNVRCVADLSTYTPGMVVGVADGIRVSLGKGSVKQYTTETLPIDINHGFDTYRINVTSGQNVDITGTPYDGQRIRCIFRGASISSLTFAGIPVDVTGANTTTVKSAIVEATYWAEISKWTLTMPQWSA